jgi:hypothetical protein
MQVHRMQEQKQRKQYEGNKKRRRRAQVSLQKD